MNAIILHGMPDRDEYYSLEYPAQSNMHWIPWLQKRLQAKDIYTQTPEMPMSFKPTYSIWKKEFERFNVGPKTILVGHSCGGGFILRWLSENTNIKIERVVLVAPWLNPDQSKSDIPAEFDTGDFFEFEFDREVSSRVGCITIFGSDNDFKDIKESIDIIRSKIPNINYREFHKYGHFCYGDMKT